VAQQILATVLLLTLLIGSDSNRAVTYSVATTRSTENAAALPPGGPQFPDDVVWVSRGSLMRTPTDLADHVFRLRAYHRPLLPVGHPLRIIPFVEVTADELAVMYPEQPGETP